MRSTTSILALKYTPVSVVGGVRRAVGGFLRYVQYRDQHLDQDRHPAADRGLDAYVRYVAHRDRTCPGGRVFGKDGALTDADRRRFVDFVASSTRGLQPKWVLGRDGKQEDRQPAVYTFILSPEDWRGLDLRRLALVAMAQLESDAGAAGIGPWFAAEHRNTAHHHVHIVLAARRELAPGRFSTFLVTRARLQRMKESIAAEIERQRGREMIDRGDSAARRRPVAVELGQVRLGRGRAQRWVWLPRRRATPVRSRRAAGRLRRVSSLAPTILRLRAVAERYRDGMAWELERETARAEREGWVR